MKMDKTRNGIDVMIKIPEYGDSKKIIEFYKQVGKETTYLGFSEGEYQVTEEQQSAMIKEINASGNNIMILAMIDGTIAGIGTISSNNKRIKSKHVGLLGIVISAEYCNAGLGTIMMDYLIKWCKDNGETAKVSLTVRKDNPRAIALYEKFGFETEGVLKKETFIDGEYYDSVVMGLMIKRL
jgi:RimJ/RimL family protein N-acetyltransferase